MGRNKVVRTQLYKRQIVRALLDEHISNVLKRTKSDVNTKAAKLTRRKRASRGMLNFFHKVADYVLTMLRRKINGGTTRKD